MDSTRSKLATATLVGLAVPLLAGAAAHITPTVVLQKQAQVIKSTLPGARQYFLKEVQIGQQDLARIREAVEFEPESPKTKFYYGEDGSGQLLGVVLFPQVNTQHGPFEVGLTVGPDGSVQRITVTKATVETKPWVKKAIATGFLEDFRGLEPGQAPTRALERLRAGEIGEMPTFAGTQVVKAVEQGLVLYRVLFATEATPGASG